MKITSTYSVRLRNFNRVFDDTVEVYRHAVDYFIELVMANWNTHFANLSRANDCIRVAEGLSVRTKKRLMTPYNFCHDFMKFPATFAEPPSRRHTDRCRRIKRVWLNGKRGRGKRVDSPVCRRPAEAFRSCTATIRSSEPDATA